MQPLSDRQRALLEALPRQQRVARIFGVACSLAGILYIIWAIGRFEPLGNPAQEIGFDAPITKPVATLYVRRSNFLKERNFDGGQARVLAQSLDRNMNFSAGLLLLAFRAILGLIVALLGFATLTVVIERGRLLRILEASGVAPVPEIAGGAGATPDPRPPPE